MREVAAVLLTLLASPLLAAPSVSAVDGFVLEGQTVTIRGSGFGARGPDYVLWDDFENRIPGAEMAAGDCPLLGDCYDQALSLGSGHHYSYYASSRVYGGGVEARADDLVTDGVGDWGLRFHFPVPAYDYHASVAIRLDAGQRIQSASVPNWKVLWFTDVPLGSANIHEDVVTYANPWLQTGTLLPYGANGHSFTLNLSTFSWGAAFGEEWEPLDFYNRKHLTAGEESVYEITAATFAFHRYKSRFHAGPEKTVFFASTTINYLYFGYMRQPTSGSSSLQYDNLYLALGATNTATNSFAGWRIGNSSSIAQCTKFDTIIPTTMTAWTGADWSAGAVTGRIVGGQFQAGEYGWVYGWDVAHSTSTGFPVRFGTGVTVDVHLNLTGG